MKAALFIVATMVLLPASAMAAPAATLADIAWMEGSWEGEGIEGAPALEAYAPAAGGQMVGHFRQLNKDGSVMFYELITIVEDGGSLAYRLKHFNADLTGWEEKDKVVSFPLTDRKGDRLDFSGLVYERTGKDSMTASVRVTEGGKTETIVFHFRRKG
ncbi:DUF6265 family protein [Novosphingobium taihuense]|uniref:DUF6265 domain-containing protein n=1 Tax=Novosphingobium taihuense TaxID=260085 RepID=A0A7W7A8S9_9SPHN|nr:DUF6265 family protein [Novosphingobium taihuense]MBB4612520.1 hypothetical protein [Novosphingobium taihuense]TWH88128.1 hypothetical protein IQ25_00243 [Novosphingobium taihuense]